MQTLKAKDMLRLERSETSMIDCRVPFLNLFCTTDNFSANQRIMGVAMHNKFIIHNLINTYIIHV